MHLRGTSVRIVWVLPLESTAFHTSRRCVIVASITAWKNARKEPFRSPYRMGEKVQNRMALARSGGRGKSTKPYGYSEPELGTESYGNSEIASPVQCGFMFPMICATVKSVAFCWLFTHRL